jgi:hypothetical protein
MMKNADSCKASTTSAFFSRPCQLTTSVSYRDDSHGNAVITVDNAGDTITLMGVHASQLQLSDFHFVDPAAAQADAHQAAGNAAIAHHAFLLRRGRRRKF